MKKNILSLAALLIASAAVFTACSSDDNISSEQPANPTGKYIMTVQASKGDDATTRALTLGRNNDDTKNVLNATWNENEEVLVYQNGSQIGTLYSAASTTYATTLTGELESAPNAGQDLTLYFHTNANPSYAGQDGTLAKIASTYDFCAPATITAGSFTVSGNTVSTTGSVSFGANQQAIVKFSLTDKKTTSAISATQLVVNDGTTEYTITPASATSEIYVALPGFSGQTVTLTATVGSDTYTYEKASVSFTNGKYYEISVKMTKAGNSDLLPGIFSVSASQTVKFSKGNLQATYDGSSWTWAFAANQWNYIGDAAGNTSVTATSPFISTNATVDLFGWVGASSTWVGVNQYGITSAGSTATGNTDGYGNVATEGLKHDWGELMGTGWRTLTGGASGEWNYLLNTRSASSVNGTANARYCKATVNSTNGLVIFPDSYTHPEGPTKPKSINTESAAYTTNSWSGADWTAMETAGCVFLPAAGYRLFYTINGSGTNGYYWSSTPHASDAKQAYGIQIYYNTSKSTYKLIPDYSSQRYFGYSVRLVQNQ